jgi:hypothetical protein
MSGAVVDKFGWERTLERYLQWILGGFITIEAGDLDEAEKIFGTHPHLDFGSIEVRKIGEQDPDRGDDELAHMFLCCHPGLPPASQVVLTLKTVGGLGVHEIGAGWAVDGWCGCGQVGSG